MTTVQEGGSPLISTIFTMTQASRANADLPEREVLLVRLACLIASDASESSYLYNLAGTAGPALTVDEVEAVLVAAAPLAGTARVVMAAERIASAMDYPISVHDLFAAGPIPD
jgi:4-carboxymuconolactone decarboxylase